jgi:hypothetical protein
MRAATESSNQLRPIIAEISVSCIARDEQTADCSSLAAAFTRNVRNYVINYAKCSRGQPKRYIEIGRVVAIPFDKLLNAFA